MLRVPALANAVRGSFARIGLLVCALVCACTQKKAPPAPAPVALAVDFSGCASMTVGPICELGADRTIRIAVRDGDATDVTIVFATSSGEVPSESSDAGGSPSGGLDLQRGSRSGGLALQRGSRRVTAPAGARALVVRAMRSGRRAEWALAVHDAETEPSIVTEARALRAKGSLDEAATLLRDGLASLDRTSRAIAMSALARVEIASGASDAARTDLAAAMDAQASVGRFSSAVDDAIALVFMHLEQRHFADARAVLERASAWSFDYYDGRVNVRFYEGVLARDTGDLRGALPKLDGAIADADAMGLARFAGVMRMERALTHADIGRIDEALATLLALEASADVPCDRGDAAMNGGWIALGAVDAGIPITIDAKTALERALALFRGECRDRRRESNTLANLAWALLQAGDRAGARARLAEARAVWPHPDSENALFAIELEGRIALAEQHAPEALARFDRLARLAAVSGARSDAWRAADGRAEALAMSGKRSDAIAASAEAERLLDEESRGVPLGEGLAQFLGARERSARRHVELLLDANQPVAALSAARAARARVIADAERSDRIGALTTDARMRWDAAIGRYRAERDALAHDADDDWSLSSAALAKARADRAARESELRAALDEAVAALPPSARPASDLPAPSSGTVLVAYFPLLHGWAAFATDGVQTIAARVASIDPSSSAADLAHALFDPIHKLLVGAARVRVVALGSLDAIDLHALPFDGAPLVAHAAVEYALDLSSTSRATHGARALVVGDPTSDLPAARREARAIASALGSNAVLLEGAAATRPAVQSALAAADLFHYAGHGVFGGRDGWASALPLADGVPLSVPDILALTRVPSEVLLAGCDTARSAHAASPGIGVAQAFLAAGADAVVAATREVDDASAADLLAALHKARAANPTRDLTSALREAQLDMGARDHAGTWSAFRVMRR